MGILTQTDHEAPQPFRWDTASMLVPLTHGKPQQKSMDIFVGLRAFPAVTLPLHEGRC
jgi:hypothetical protein